MEEETDSSDKNDIKLEAIKNKVTSGGIFSSKMKNQWIMFHLEESELTRDYKQGEINSK